MTNLELKKALGLLTKTTNSSTLYSLMGSAVGGPSLSSLASAVVAKAAAFVGLIISALILSEAFSLKLKSNW